jgi:hypothetical protein
MTKQGGPPIPGLLYQGHCCSCSPSGWGPVLRVDTVPSRMPHTTAPVVIRWAVISSKVKAGHGCAECSDLPASIARRGGVTRSTTQWYSLTAPAPTTRIPLSYDPNILLFCTYSAVHGASLAHQKSPSSHIWGCARSRVCSDCRTSLRVYVGQVSPHQKSLGGWGTRGVVYWSGHASGHPNLSPRFDTLSVPGMDGGWDHDDNGWQLPCLPDSELPRWRWTATGNRTTAPGHEKVCCSGAFSVSSCRRRKLSSNGVASAVRESCTSASRRSVLTR